MSQVGHGNLVSEFAIQYWIILLQLNLEKSQICNSEMISFPKNGIRKSPKERTQWVNNSFMNAIPRLRTHKRKTFRTQEEIP